MFRNLCQSDLIYKHNIKRFFLSKGKVREELYYHLIALVSKYGLRFNLPFTLLVNFFFFFLRNSTGVFVKKTKTKTQQS